MDNRPTAYLRDVTEPTKGWNPLAQPRRDIQYIDVSAISRDRLEIVSPTHLQANFPSRARKIIQEGDTIFATVRPTLRRVAMIPSALDGQIASTAFCVLRPKRDVIDPRYLFFASISDFVLDEVAGLQSGASYPAVRDKDIFDCSIPIPPLEEQHKIASALSICRQALLNEGDALNLAEALKRATMRELFMRGLRGNETKETEFGPIPLNWSVDTLDRSAFIQTGAAKGRKFADPETVEVPYLRVANVQDGHLDLREMKTIQIRRHEIDRFRLQDGDVVLTEGGDFDKLGRGFIWRGELDLCVHQNHVFAVRTDRSRILPEFFAYQAQSSYGKAYFLKVAHKTTNLACINSTKLKAFPVLIPPSLDEQREVVAILAGIDAKIDLHKRKRALLEELFRALLHTLITGEILVSELNLSALETEAAG